MMKLKLLSWVTLLSFSITSVGPLPSFAQEQEKKKSSSDFLPDQENPELPIYFPLMGWKKIPLNVEPKLDFFPKIKGEIAEDKEGRLVQAKALLKRKLDVLFPDDMMVEIVVAGYNNMNTFTDNNWTVPYVYVGHLEHELESKSTEVCEVGSYWAKNEKLWIGADNKFTTIDVEQYNDNTILFSTQDLKEWVMERAERALFAFYHKKYVGKFKSVFNMRHLVDHVMDHAGIKLQRRSGFSKLSNVGPTETLTLTDLARNLHQRQHAAWKERVDAYKRKKKEREEAEAALAKAKAEAKAAQEKAEAEAKAKAEQAATDAANEASQEELEPVADEDGQEGEEGEDEDEVEYGFPEEIAEDDDDDEVEYGFPTNIDDEELTEEDEGGIAQIVDQATGGAPATGEQTEVINPEDPSEVSTELQAEELSEEEMIEMQNRYMQVYLNSPEYFQSMLKQQIPDENTLKAYEYRVPGPPYTFGPRDYAKRKANGKSAIKFAYRVVDQSDLDEDTVRRFYNEKARKAKPHTSHDPEIGSAQCQNILKELDWLNPDRRYVIGESKGVCSVPGCNMPLREIKRLKFDDQGQSTVVTEIYHDSVEPTLQEVKERFKETWKRVLKRHSHDAR